MVKLKTLKDIKPYYSSILGNKYDEYDLKQEAIKWIKELQNYGTFNYEDKSDFDRTWGKIEWIKHFFNITEEDLKDDKK